MDFAVIHTIKDAAAWDEATAGSGALPPGFKNTVFVVAEDKSRGVCLWDAPDLESLQGALDRLLGEAAVNDVFPVVIQPTE